MPDDFHKSKINAKFDHLSICENQIAIHNFALTPERRVELIGAEWRRWSQFRAVVYIWETFNDVMKDNQKAYLLTVRKKVLDGAGKRDALYQLIADWIGRNWEDWGEKWLLFLRIARNNAVLQGKLLYREDKTKTASGNPYTPISLSWLFEGFGFEGECMIDWALKGKFDKYETKPETGELKKESYYGRPYYDPNDPEADFETSRDPDYQG